VLPRTVYRPDVVRSQPGFSIDDRSHELWRFDQYAVDGIARGPEHPNDVFLWVIQYPAIRGGIQLGSDRKIKFVAGYSPDEIGWISDVQLSTPQCHGFEIPVQFHSTNGADLFHV